MKTLLTRKNFKEIYKDLFFEGTFKTGNLLEMTMSENFNRNFTYAFVTNIDGKEYVIAKRENTANTYDIYSIK